jgi:biopolymer transport protein ExbB
MPKYNRRIELRADKQLREVVMRQRVLWSWFGAFLCAVLMWSTAPAVFSLLTVGNASSALAAPTVDDELDAKTPPKAAAKTEADKKVDKNGGERLAVDKNAIEKPGEETPETPKESFLGWLYRSLTLRYVLIFLFISFNAVALVVMISLGLRRECLCPDDVALAFEGKLNEKKYQEAYELVRNDKSFLAKVLTAGMSKLSEGYGPAVAAMQEIGEEQNMKLEQRNSYIALIAQIGPMFGLLGTVDGMVTAFDVIAHSNVTPKPSELAQGIGTALVTTVVGLWIAIPMIAFYHIIRNRTTRLVMEAGTVSGNLMKRFETVPTSTKKS